MKETKKARAAGGTAERATEQAALAGGSVSFCKCSTTAACRQGLLALLPLGEADALSARELARITGRSARDCVREIEQLRLQGAPVCACQRGYFVPRDTTELSRYLRAFDRRLRHIRATREALEDALVAVSGQQMIGGDSYG